MCSRDTRRWRLRGEHRRQTEVNNKSIAAGISTNLEDREARASDFGRMFRKMPKAVARPTSVEEVAGLVRSAARDNVGIAIRGGAHSQSGRSLAPGGLVLDTAELNRVEVLRRDLVRAGGGAHWGKVMHTLSGTGQLPPVLLDVAEASVGGTLSAGGLGTTSHRYGLQVGHVEQLEVVTGTGERVRCSRTRNAELFDAVRGGQGQFGIITDAWLRLRRAGKRIRSYQLRYRDYERFADDFDRVIEEERFDRLRAETRIHDNEIIMGAGIEYDGEHDDAKALDGLGFDEIASIRDTAEVARAGMYLRWFFNPRSYHPWRDWFMPWETLRAVLEQPWLKRDWVPPSLGNWIGVYPIRTAAIGAPLLMHPKGKNIFSYSILTVLNDYEKASELSRRLKEITPTLVELGGKSYLSGDVGYSRREWEGHYGETLARGTAWKREFDPKRVFSGAGMPF